MAEKRLAILTLKVATGILPVTHRLVMMIICVKQHFNPITENKVVARQQTCFKVAL